MAMGSRGLKGVAAFLLVCGFLANIAYGQSSIPLVGSVSTASPAETIGINGNNVYTCDDNEISIIDVTQPSKPAVLGTMGSPTSTANTFCDVQRGDLVQMLNTSAPAFRVYDISNPASTSLIASTTVNKQFFGPPYYQGNTAFFGTNVIVFGGGYPGPITDQAGDFVSMDITNLSAPAVLGTLETQTHGPVQGGSFNVVGTTPYNNQLAYVGSTTSQGSATQTGVGQLWVVDTTNPAAMSMVTQVNVPGTLQIFGPLIQGNTAVTIGDSGGWREPCCGNNAFTGNIVITVYDVSDPRNPQITANVTTPYLPGPGIGRGTAVIGPHLFLYGGVLDSSGNNNFLLVDTTNPASPSITLSPTSASVNYVRVVGSQLYAPTVSGLQIYSLSGSIAPSISTNGVQNGASFQPGVAPASWVTIKGTNLSPVTDTWDNSIVNGKLPTTLDGVSVSMGGKPAYIEYVSPTQINVLAPNLGAGPVQVTVTTNSVGASSTFSVTANSYGPAFFTWPNNQPVATRQDFSFAVKPGTFQGVTTVAAKPGDVIILWGTGFGPTSPAVPVGVVVPSDQTYSTASPPFVTINNVQATVYGAALAPGFVGLYQIAIQVPASLGDGDWPIVANISGVSSPSGVLLTVQK
jgi:uncharacterized protein (TIGR03437 family)